MSASMNTISEKTKEIAAIYQDNITSGFTPMPIIVERTENAKLYDIDGKEYIDLLAMFAVQNMGHNNPKIIKAAQDALGKSAMVNSSIMSPSYARFAQKLSKAFGYDKFVALTGGAEAADAAIKIARKWAYQVKKIPAGESVILSVAECFHGTTISTHALSNPRSTIFGPYGTGVGAELPDGSVIEYGNLEQLEHALKTYGDRVAAFIVEPVQGYAGVIIPPKGYFKGVYDLCKKYNVLMIADEVQTGFGRTGYNLASFKDDVKPDLVVLGKAISGGIFPLSGVIGDNEIMNLMNPGEIGATMAATPPATEAGIAALDILFEEKLAERSLRLGEVFKDFVTKENPPHVKEVVGQGLFIAIVLDSSINGRRLSGILAKRGVIARVTATNRMRISPPLTIPEEELLAGAKIICDTLKDYETVEGPIPYEDNTYFS